MSEVYGEALEAWVAEPQNTARSVIATIFGDTIAPVGGSIWLSQLFALTNVFGFSPRLVRTSLYRLASEGWCSNERVGRESRYFLTELATGETRQAEKRIYHDPHPQWSGEWTAAFLDSPSLPEEVRTPVAQRLGWLGFRPLPSGVMVSPTSTIDEAKAVCARASPSHTVPLANLSFPDLDALVTEGFFVEALSIEHRAKAYEEFVSLYESLTPAKASDDPPRAFAVRTMLVHDLRRIRLSGPDIPSELLPDGWPGTRAFEVARTLYPALSKAASPWLASILDADYPAAFDERFDGAQITTQVDI